MTKDKAAAILAAHGIADKVVFLGYRSPNSKYGEYDDIGALYTPDGYEEFKLNTLPTKWEGHIAKLMPGVYKYRKGIHGMHHLNLAQRNDGSYVCPGDKAILDWLHTHPGKDHPEVLRDGNPRILPYWAYIQAGPVTVLRHGAMTTETKTNPADYPMINLHHGGHYTTSSEGCQTFKPEDYGAVRADGYAAMDKYGQLEIWYCLVQM